MQKPNTLKILKAIIVFLFDMYFQVKASHIQYFNNCFRKARQKSENIVSEKNILICGAGRVAAPLVEYLHREKSIGITVACEQLELADGLAREYPGIECAYLNASEGSSGLKV